MSNAVRRAWVAVAMLALAAVIVAERVHTYAEPIERDIAGYAVIGHEMLRGRHLYTDLWERKPPLLYATFAVAERLTGYGPAEVFAVNVAAALATLIGCYGAGRAGGGTAGGLVAAGLWVLLGGDPYTWANQPNAEAFVNAALTGAVALLVRPIGGWRSALAIGALFTLATFYEQHVVVTCAALAVGYLIASEKGWSGAVLGPDATESRVHGGVTGRGRPGSALAPLRRMAIAAAVGAVAWSGLIAYFAAIGRLHAMIEVLYREPLHGVSVAANLRKSLLPENLLPACMTWIGGPLALILLGAVAGNRVAGAGRRWFILIGWLGGTWIVVALPGRFFPHYYQCWIPPLCVAAGWSAGRMLGPTRWPRAVGPTAIAAVFIAVALRQLPPYRWSPSEWANRKYASENFVEQAYLARRLMTILRPGERFWVLGQDNTVYFMTGQSPVTGLLYLEPIIDGGNGATYWPRLIDDLNRADPPLVVVHFPWDYDLPPDAPVVPWLRARYVSAGTNLTCPSYDLYVRRGNADLLRRLKSPPPFPPFQRAEWGSQRQGQATGHTVH